MNNLYSVVSKSLGFTRAISVEPEKFPVLIEDILIKPNDFLTENNFNYSLSCLYQDFLSIVSDSYVYSPNFPATNPFFDSNNNLTGTLCGTFVPYNFNSSGLDSISYYVNGIPHSNYAFNTVYTTHDFIISGDYLTIAVGILSATTLSQDLSSNVYYPALGIYNFSLSSILESSVAPNNSEFPNTGVAVNSVVPNFGAVTKFLNKNLNLKFNSIAKLKISNERLYVLDNISNKFLIYDVSDVTVNRTSSTSFEVPLETLGFATSSRNNSRKISSFCVNENYIAFFNYVNNAISIFSTNLTQLFDYSQDKVSVSGSRNTEAFADIEFDTQGNLYLLTQAGTVYIYSVTDTALTLLRTYSIYPKTSTIFSTLSTFQSNSQAEVFKKLSFSKSDTDVYYVSTNQNIYKRFVEKNTNIGQFNNFINNTTYYSTLSNIADPFNTLLVPNTTNYPKQKSPFDFYKYKVNSINSVKYQGYELFSVCFIDNCTYATQDVAFGYPSGQGKVGNVVPYGYLSFKNAINTYGMNPVSASGITFIVDKPNYINLNNDDLSAVQIYTFDEIAVKPDEFITDFTINKSLRKLLYNIFNYQTYQAFKPVVDIDINNNALYKKLEYIVSYNKDQNITNFDNFIGINEITSTVFLNRCFTKVYELLATLQSNYNSRVINVYPRYNDSVLLNQSSQKFLSLYNNSEPYISGEYDTEVQPLNPNLCVVEDTANVPVSPIPTSTPAPQPTSLYNTPTPTPAPSPTLPPTPTPSGYVLVNKIIQHVATVYLNNEYEFPVPQPPFPNYDIKPLSAIYDGTGIDTIVSEFSAYFDQAGFYIELALANGDFTKLVGKSFGDYTLQSYIPSSVSEYTLGAQGCGLEFGNVQGISPTPTSSVAPTATVTPTPTPTPSITPTNTGTAAETPTPTPSITPTNTGTAAVTSTPTPTITPTNTGTAAETPTPTPTITPTNTGTAAETLTPTATPTNTPTNTPTPTITPSVTPSLQLSYTVEYFVVGGGAGGGNAYTGAGGGGCSGDVYSNSNSITTGTAYTFQLAGPASANTDGQVSKFDTYTSFTAGRGGYVNSSNVAIGGNYGGGGSSSTNNLGTKGSGAGSAYYSASVRSGGGGKGSVGSGQDADVYGGSGGSASFYSPPVPQWVYDNFASGYGGGGGGGISTTGGGLAGVGSNGGNGGKAVLNTDTFTNGFSGNAGSGQGGGGGASGRDDGSQPASGGSGGSGCIIVRFLSSYSDPTIGGTSSYTSTKITTGGYTMIKYVPTVSADTSATGTITFNP